MTNKSLPATDKITYQNAKIKSVKNACVKQEHPISTTQLLTFKDVAGILKVSERTVRRLIDSNELSVIYIRNSPRVTNINLQEYINQQVEKCYNSKRMVLDVRKSKGNRTCKKQQRKKVYTKEETLNSGGSVTSMNPAKELAALLEL